MTERKTLSQLWRESGKIVPFKQFAQDFDNRKFRNFVNTDTANTLFKPNEPIKQNEIEPVIQPEHFFDKKQGVLLMSFGAAAGVIIGLLLVKHLKK